MNQDNITAEFSFTDAVRIGRAVRSVERTAYRSRYTRPAHTGSSQNSVHVIVQITGLKDSTNDMYPGIMVNVGNYSDTFENLSQTDAVSECWLILDPADIGLADGDKKLIGYSVNGVLAGILPSDELPIVFRSQKSIPVSTSEAPTTSTIPPCSGSCVYTYTYATKTWAKTSGTCSSGCVCNPPTFCPEMPFDTSCATTVTYVSSCREGATEITVYPNCTGTTTSTTTANPSTTTTSTTPNPICGTRCKWYWNPATDTFQRIDVDEWYCNPPCNCSVPPLDTPHDGCNPVFTNCIPPASTTQPPCGGRCKWVKTLSGWALNDSTCTGECNCDKPTYEGECGDASITFCYPPDGSPPNYTTPHPNPTSCDGLCTYKYFSGAWVLQSSTCPSCACVPPIGSGTSCEYRVTPCGEFPTTTTSTTTTPNPSTTTTTTTTTTSTTSTLPPCGRRCRWVLFCTECTLYGRSYAWVLDSSACTTSPRVAVCQPTYPHEVTTLDRTHANDYIDSYGGCDNWKLSFRDPITGAVYALPHEVPVPGFERYYCDPAAHDFVRCFCCDGSETTTTTTTSAPTSTTTTTTSIPTTGIPTPPPP